VLLAGLLLVRFRWSPELVAALAGFLLLWAFIRILGDGFTTSRIGMSLSAAFMLFGYPDLRRDVRTPE
jgi:hypothetical protein